METWALLTEALAAQVALWDSGVQAKRCFRPAAPISDLSCELSLGSQEHRNPFYPRSPPQGSPSTPGDLRAPVCTSRILLGGILRHIETYSLGGEVVADEKHLKMTIIGF